MPDADNTAMARYWNEVAGPRWVQRQAMQEARNIEMLEQLLAAARPAAGEHVLDIGCGTGVTTEPYAKAVGPHGHVTAADISKPMLDAARQRIDQTGLGNVTLLLADAQTHEFPEAAFDLLTSRLGVMFFADPIAAFRNLIKALRRGGRLCMAVWATVEESLHQHLPLDVAIKHLGPPATQSPHAPGPNVYGDRDYLRGILDAAGFADVAIEPRRFLVHGDTAARAAEHSSQMGAVQRLMDEKNAKAATRAAIIRDIEAAFRPYERDGATRIPATFLLVTAHRP